MWLLALIANAVIGLANGLVQILWSLFVEPFLGIFEWILNAANGGFNSFGGAVANLIGQIISWFLSLGKVVTQIIDAIFGSDWTGGLEKLQGQVTSWGKSENHLTIDRSAPTIDYRFGMINAYKTGDSFGKGIDNKISGFFDKNKKDPGDDNFKDLLDDVYNNSALSNDNLNNIANDTSSISDSMDIAEEDLQYMRDLAEQEAINRFTTADLRVEFTANNSINSNLDIDGVCDYMANRTAEQLALVAEGVH